MAPKASRSLRQLANTVFIMSICLANQVLSAPTTSHHRDANRFDTNPIPTPIRLDDALEAIRVGVQEGSDGLASAAELVHTVHQSAVLAKGDVIDVLERRTLQQRM